MPPLAKPEESLDIERIRCFSSRHGIQSYHESKSSSRNAGDIRTCGFDSADCSSCAPNKEFRTRNSRREGNTLALKTLRGFDLYKFFGSQKGFTQFCKLHYLVLRKNESLPSRFNNQTQIGNAGRRLKDGLG